MLGKICIDTNISIDLYGSIKASLAEKGTPIPENNSFIGR
jgi:predicted nucleic acid-binding protein